MASGDTKTEAMLNVLGNGGSGDEFRGCCNTKTQQYILDAIDRINSIQPGGGSDPLVAYYNAEIVNDPDLEANTPFPLYKDANLTNPITYNEMLNMLKAGTVSLVSTEQGLLANYSGAIITWGGEYGDMLVLSFYPFDGELYLLEWGPEDSAPVYVNTTSFWPPEVVQTTGTSQTDVMSQNATTSMVFADPSTTRKIQIGNNSSTVSSDGISIGYGSSAGTSAAQNCVAIGSGASISGPRIGSVALGANSGGNITKSGMVDIGSAFTSYGYEGNSNYRLLTGLYDPQNAHDAATKGYVDTRMGGVTIVSISQTDYDNLPTKDPNTLYVITGA